MPRENKLLRDDKLFHKMTATDRDRDRVRKKRAKSEKENHWGGGEKELPSPKQQTILKNVRRLTDLLHGITLSAMESKDSRYQKMLLEGIQGIGKNTAALHGKAKELKPELFE